METSQAMIHTISILVMATLHNFSPARAPTESGYYCGLYCVLAAAKIVGQRIPIESVINPKYVTHLRGSSSSQIVSALEDHHITACTTSNLGLSTLLQLNKPLIMHVRTPNSMMQYSHWMLLIGRAEDNRYTVFYPTDTLDTMTAQEILAIWDGHTIIVGQNECPVVDIDFILESALILGSVMLLLLLSRTHRSLFAILMTSAAAAILWNIISDRGLIRSDRSYIYATAAYHQYSFPMVSFSDVEVASRTGSALIVDCRMPSAYFRKHIPGSVSIPINTDYHGIDRQLADSPNDRMIICYCQSSACAWSDTVAKQIRARGFTNVVIYADGYNDWHEKREAQ
jgi:rhodanese-related sulfurtransferase